MSRRSTFPLVTLLLCLGLAACSSTPRMDAPVNDDWQARRDLLESITQWEFTGRIGVRDDQDPPTSRIHWRQQT